MADSDTSTTRMGRFKICAPNSPGPPEQLSHGRFRIIPQGNKHTKDQNKHINLAIHKKKSFKKGFCSKFGFCLCHPLFFN